MARGRDWDAAFAREWERLEPLLAQTISETGRRIADQPRSTQELAPLVGISEHLRQLADAGIVQSRREGYYVLYSLVPDRIDALSDAVRQFVKGE